MNKEEDTRYWLTAAEDFRRFRKGEIPMLELIRRYPKFEIKEGSHCYVGFKEDVKIIIPEDCPLPMIPQIVSAVEKGNGDVCRIDYDIRIAYQSAWEAFPPLKKIEEICEAKKSVVFKVSLMGKYWRSNLDPIIDIRFCVREGSHGDSDGYGVEDDTWIVGLLNMDGSWFKEWYIEG